MNNHTAARLRAQKMVDNPKMFNRDNLGLAACHLDLRAKALAVLKIVDRNQEDINALREALREEE
jgi:hypothetical protein